MGAPWPKKRKNRYEGIHGGFDYFFLFATLMTTVPLVSIAAGLVVVILWTQVELPASVFDVDPKPDYNAYFIDFSATKLTTLASWISSFSPYLPTFYLGLLAFPFASHLRDQSGPSQFTTEQLPTPRQLSIFIQLFDGSLQSIWSWLPVRSWRKVEKPLPILNRLASIFCLSIFLSVTIWGADTWLHIATTTVEQSIFRNSTAEKLSTRSSRVQYPNNCSLIPQSNGAVDNLHSVCFRTLRPLDLSGAALSSDEHSGSTDVHDTQDHGTLYSYLFDVRAPAQVDVLATTMAVSALCGNRAISTILLKDNGTSFVKISWGTDESFAWKYTAEGPGLNDSTSHFSATPTSEMPLAVGWYTDKELKEPYEYYQYNASVDGQMSNSDWLLTKLDPNFGDRAHVAVLTAFLKSGSMTINTLEDPSLYAHSLHHCEISLSVMNYTRLGPNITTSQPVAAPESVYAGLIASIDKVYRAPWTRWAPGSIVYEMSQLMAANMTAAMGNTSDTEIRKNIEVLTQNALRRSVASYLTLLTSSAPSLQEQEREIRLLTRVPKLPLWTLVFLCILSSMLGFGISSWAVIHHSPANRAIRACLTVPGIIENWCRDTGHDATNKIHDEARLLGHERQGFVRFGVEEIGGTKWRFNISDESNPRPRFRKMVCSVENGEETKSISRFSSTNDLSIRSASPPSPEIPVRPVSPL